MKKSSKILLSLFSAVCAVGLCLCGGAGVLLYRYFDGGVNPFRELRMATVGESIEIKEIPDETGKISRQLLIDSIDHGTQYVKTPRAPGQLDWSRVPTTYYHNNGPVGMAFSKVNWFPAADLVSQGDVRMPANLVGVGATSSLGGPLPMFVAAWSEPPVAVVMMNNGTLAAYVRPFQVIDFYESNRRITQLSVGEAKDTPTFTYLTDAKKRGAHARVFQGNERTTFEKESPRNFYHLILLDTSRGHPGLPTKVLLTKEAWQSYLNALSEDGIVCVHTSSRDYRLSEVVGATCNSLGLSHLSLHDGLSDRRIGHYTSEWVVVARKAEYLRFIQDACIRRDGMRENKGPHEKMTVLQLPMRSDLVWTDAGANSLAGVRR